MQEHKPVFGRPRKYATEEKAREANREKSRQRYQQKKEEMKEYGRNYRKMYYQKHRQEIAEKRKLQRKAAKNIEIIPESANLCVQFERDLTISCK